MKRKNIILVTLFALSVLFTIQSCSKEDSTTFSTKHAFTQPVPSSPVVRADGTVLVKDSTVNLTWASTNADGAPAKWDVYFGTDAKPSLFKSGLAQTNLEVKVADGKTYYWMVATADANGIKTISDIKSFTAVTGKNPAILVDLTCETNVLTAVGLNLTADKTVDLRLLVLKKSDMSVVATIDNGAAAESYDGFEKLPNGDYVLGIDIASTINAGDFNSPISLSLALNFTQLGIINQKLDFPNVMTNSNPCSLYRTYLATVKKVGPVYTITKDVSFLTPAVITWKGTDADNEEKSPVPYPSQITSTESCTATTLTGVGFGWMKDYWGEVIVSGGTLSYTVSGDVITIPLQKYLKTTYKGKAQPEYSISGTGTINKSGAFPVYTIKYDLIQSGSTILTTANGVPAGYLEAKITTNPAGL